MNRSELFIPGSEMTELTPVKLNIAEDKTHYWKWCSDLKGWWRGSIKPEVKVLHKNINYWPGGSEPLWKEAVVIERIGRELYKIRITDAAADNYNQIDFAKEQDLKIAAAQN